MNYSIEICQQFCIWNGEKILLILIGHEYWLNFINNSKPWQNGFLFVICYFKEINHILLTEPKYSENITKIPIEKQQF